MTTASDDAATRARISIVFPEPMYSPRMPPWARGDAQAGAATLAGGSELARDTTTGKSPRAKTGRESTGGSASISIIAATQLIW